MSGPALHLPPALVRGLLYPGHERLLRRPTFAYLAELEASQWQPREAIEQRQREGLSELLRLAHTHCPWHRDRIEVAGLAPSQGGEPVSFEAFRRLPTMTKADARAAGDAMVWGGVPGGAQPYNTGGSSGEPLIFRFGRRRQASDAAGRMRARRWWGVDVGAREVYLWGSPVELGRTDRIKTVRDRLFNQLVLNAFDMSPTGMDDYVAAIRAFRPACIYGYASSVALLAAHAAERGARLRLPGLRVVCTTGEPLFAHQRRLIGEVFGVPVADEFGSRDIGFTAHQSPAGQLLLLSESIVLEVLDAQGEPVPPGQVGEAVMTGLCSEAQPFLRYRTGDMVRVSGERCREGRGLHVIDEVVGRSTDFVVRADGTVMHALAVIYVLRALEGVAEFRFIQHRVDDVEVLVVPAPGWGDITAEQARTGLRARLGREVRVRIREVEAIPPEASGKYRYVVSHVPLPAALRVATAGEGRS